MKYRIIQGEKHVIKLILYSGWNSHLAKSNQQLVFSLGSEVVAIRDGLKLLLAITHSTKALQTKKCIGLSLIVSKQKYILSQKMYFCFSSNINTELLQ